MSSMQTDNQGHQQLGEEENTITDAEQIITLTSAQAAQQLGVEPRTVRRYINDGINTTDGKGFRLKASQVRTNRGLEWHISQSDLDEFKQVRDQSAIQGQSAAQIQEHAVMRAEQSQALTASVHLFAAELERRAQELAQAQTTIERLALEAGRQTGRNEQLEQELVRLRQRLALLGHQSERPHSSLHRIRFLPLEGNATLHAHQSSLPLWPQRDQSSSES